MRNIIKFWQIGAIIFICSAGVVLHFLYEWTNCSIWVAPFSAVNESIWEHMKLLFFPMFVFSLIKYIFIGKNIENFWCSELIGIIFGLMIIPIIYYTYSGILGINADWFNIMIFFIAAGASSYIEFKEFNNKKHCCKYPLTAFVSICLIAVKFVVLTFVQPEIPLFRDMVTGKFGI